MVEWASSESERTFDQSAAIGRKEPTLTDAARCINVQYHESTKNLQQQLRSQMWILFS